MALTIWCNSKFNAAATELLRAGTQAYRTIFSAHANSSVLTAGQSDPTLAEADIAFGQPDAEDCLRSSRLRWVEVSSAGYTRYDTEEFRLGFQARGAAFTNASGVFADSCAQHLLAMLLSLNRQLPACLRDQLTDHSWHYTERRYASRVLTGQTVLLLGYGAIGRRLTELLAPFGVTIYAVRRQTRSETGVRIVAVEELTRVLPLADHIINILPENEATVSFVNARRLACCRPDARFYNIGRGATVDQPALIHALESGRLAAAFLDVMSPEPLPPDHPLWTTPNCYISPHIGGGRHDQDEALVRHFLANLAAFERGEPMTDRVL
ncbi:MAG: D-2-hydroxyacid dehydrogenase [Opitutae bacterium]|nr:D-2-hydroxyacid dehydrogenase [Opitutae bacterium]